MEQCTVATPVRRSTAHASLAVLGVKLRQLDFLTPLREEVKIAQKAVKLTPFEKLCDCFIGILAGAHGIVEINEGLRVDPGLPAVFGRTACAEQSVIARRSSVTVGQNSQRNSLHCDQYHCSYKREEVLL